MTPPALVIPERARRSVVHGWAFRNHTAEEIALVREFLANGHVDVLVGTRYHSYAVLLATEGAAGRRGAKAAAAAPKKPKKSMRSPAEVAVIRRAREELESLWDCPTPVVCSDPEGPGLCERCSTLAGLDALLGSVPPA